LSGIASLGVHGEIAQEHFYELGLFARGAEEPERG